VESLALLDALEVLVRESLHSSLEVLEHGAFHVFHLVGLTIVSTQRGHEWTNARSVGPERC
jgi:hypothetical protein